MTAASVFRQNLFQGKNVLISGGGTGIGFGVAKAFCAHGARVFIMGRRENVLQEAVEKLKADGGAADYVQGDVTDFDKCTKAVNTVVDKAGSLHVLCNNAAGNFMAPGNMLTTNGLKKVLDIDFVGTFNMSKAAYEPLKAAKGGVILNTTATLQYKAMPYQLHAAGAKAGIDVLTNTLAVEWGHDLIRVVGIAPGPIEGTEGGPGGRVFGVQGDKMMDMFMASAMPYHGQVEDIGNTALFLASPAAKNISGTTVVVDGGHWHGTAPFYNMTKKAVISKMTAEKANRAKK
eukprot:Clim_evm23s235 gene=Clim_evmTU23s235